MPSVDVVVIGAGVVGLACARRFALAGYDTLVLESEATFGTGISSRSSEVVHAGIYYLPDSLKARLCVAGRDSLYAYCASRGINFRKIGKLIVASDEVQLSELAAIRDRAHCNGCTEVDWVDRLNIKRLAPELRCAAALFSPKTGIVDSHNLMLSLVADIESAGGTIAYRTTVRSAASDSRGIIVVRLDNDDETIISTRCLINAAGLNAPRVAAAIEGCSTSIPNVAYAKGSYFTYSGRVPFPHLVYPVPESGGLGVHLTFDLGGGARFGPDVEWVDFPDYTVNANAREKFATSIRKYWPTVDADKLEPGYAGIRPKLGTRECYEKDFVIQDESYHGIPNLWNLLGIESPGLTASLALAEHVFSTHRDLT
jgi:L-2-hydroxyglutarate oxidase LhgO